MTDELAIGCFIAIKRVRAYDKQGGHHLRSSSDYFIALIIQENV